MGGQTQNRGHQSNAAARQPKAIDLSSGARALVANPLAWCGWAVKAVDWCIDPEWTWTALQCSALLAGSYVTQMHSSGAQTVAHKPGPEKGQSQGMLTHRHR